MKRKNRTFPMKVIVEAHAWVDRNDRKLMRDIPKTICLKSRLTFADLHKLFGDKRADTGIRATVEFDWLKQ